MDLSVVPQFIVGAQNVVADSQGCRRQVLASGWTFTQEVVDELVARWLATVNLFTLALNYRLPVYFSPLSDPMAAGTCFSTRLGCTAGIRIPFCADQSGPKQAGVVHSDLSHPHLSLLASEWVVSCAPESDGGSSVSLAHMWRPTQTAPLPSSAPEPRHAEPSCVETVQRFARQLGLSRRVLRQLSLCRHQSTCRLYQHRWECYRALCSRRGHSVLSPPVPKIADFLMCLCTEKHLFVAVIKGYRSTLVSVFKYRLLKLLDSFIFRDLIRSFEIERPRRLVGPPS